jgi:hypothetical protein
VEHIVDIPGKRIASFKVPVRENGVRVWRDMKEFDTSGEGVHPNWPPRFFAQITDSYLTATGNVGNSVGNAASVLLSARGLMEFALPMMKTVAAGG